MIPLDFISAQSFMRKRVRADQNLATEYEDGMNDMPVEQEISFNKKKPYPMLHPTTKPKQHSTNNISNVTKSKIASFSKQQSGKSSNQSSHESSLIEDDYKFIERFNRDMMDQFMEHQRQTQV